MKHALAIPLTLLAFLAAPLSYAVEETPQSIPGGTMVTTDQAKALHDKGATFVDTRVAAEFVEKTIKNSINIPFKTKFPKESKTDPADAFDLTKLPADKGATVVFYCVGSPCWKGYKGAVAAIKAGYKQVNWYRDGFPAWSAKGLSTQ
ncbi:MAG: rhodanese-like domain-containing protein [Rhodocyclaceae bacterium]|nr:rhodanese-like domain-containing protein [Rhodocyclaceae bacterium]